MANFNITTGVATFNAGGTPATSADNAVAKQDAEKKTLTFSADATGGAQISGSKSGWTIDAAAVTSGVSVTAAASNTITTGEGADSISLNGSSVTATMGDGADSVVGTGSNANLNVGDGDNKVSVAGSAITVTGGYGKNEVSITGSDARVTLGGGDDKISVVGKGAVVNAGQGNDSITIDGASATVTAGDGDDSVSVANGNSDYIDLGRGNDSLTLEGTYATVTSADGDNYISIKGVGANVTTGRDNDSIQVVGNDAVVSAGDGDNIISVKGTGAAVTTGRGDDKISVTKAYATITSGAGNDSIYADEHDAHITAGAGDDQISAKGNNAYVDAGAGHDSISIGGNYATVSAGAGNDSIQIAGMGATVAVGDGNNEVSLQGKNSSVTAGTGNDSITIAAGGSDYVAAGDGRNEISVKGDNDTVVTGAGSDTITVDGKYASVTIGDGNDSVSVGGAYATVTGGAGNDTINVAANSSVTEASGNNRIEATDGNETITSGDGKDTIVANGDYNTIAAGDGNNHVTATGKAATITSGAGKDTILAGEQAEISAGAGADSIHTGANATITAGAGKDTVSVDAAGEVFTDYSFPEDRIVIANGLTLTSDNFDTDGKITSGSADITITTQGNGFYAAQISSTTDTTKHVNYAWTGEDAATLEGGAATEAFYVTGTKNDEEGDLILGTKYDDTIIAGSNDSVLGGKGKDTVSIASGAEGVYVGLDTGDGSETVTGSITTGFEDDGTTVVLGSLDKLKATFSTDGTDLTLGIKSASLYLDNVATGSANSVSLKANYGGTTYNTQIFDGTATLGDETQVVVGDSDNKTNTLKISNNDDTTIDLSNQQLLGDTRYYQNVTVVDASADTGDNILIGGSKSTTLVGGAGATSLWGGSSKADSLVGGTGSDIFVYGNGDGRDTVSNYDSENDVLYFLDAGAYTGVKRTTSGGLAVKFTSSNSSTAKLTVLNTTSTDTNRADDKYVFTTNGTDQLTAKVGLYDSVNNFTYEDDTNIYIGGKQSDTLTVGDADNANIWLDNSGMGGNKYYESIKVVDASSSTADVTLAGAGTNDTLYASKGDSSLFGGAGNDLLVANSDTTAGSASFYFAKGAGKDTIQGSGADDRVMLYDISVSDIASYGTTGTNDYQVTLTDGSKLTITSVSDDMTVAFTDASGNVTQSATIGEIKAL